MRAKGKGRLACMLVGLTVGMSLGACDSKEDTWRVSGTVSGAVSQGVTVSLSGAGSGSTTTAASGHYTFSSLANGRYTVTPTLAGFAFDPASRTVSVSGADVLGQDFTGSAIVYGHFVATGSMTRSRGTGNTATLLPNSKVLLAGRDGASGECCSAELYDPATGTFAVTGSMSSTSPPTATPLPNGRVLMACGGGSPELYDPTSGTFEATGAMFHEGIAGCSAMLLPTGKVLVFGATDRPVAEFFDPSTATFTEAPSPAESLCLLTPLPGGLVLAARHNGLYDRCNELGLYDPATAVFVPGGSFSWEDPIITATLLSDGTVLITGRVDYYNLGATLYDPSSQEFLATIDPIEDRVVGHTATLLPGGKVLLAGGCAGFVPTSGCRGAQPIAELYDPATRSFEPTAGMTTPRWGHTATLLPDNSVLIAGGASDSAELYVPEQAP